MTSFILKIIGVITMLFDHIGDAIIGHFSFFNLIGRISFPIFAFQAVQGYIHTKNFKKHMLKLLIFAIISQIPFMLFLSTFTTEIYTLNIFFTLFLGCFALFVYDKCSNKIIGLLLVILTSIIAFLLKVDYGYWGILLMFCFYLFKDTKLFMAISTVVLCFLRFVPDIIDQPLLWKIYLLCAFFTSLSIIFILFYNKKEGPKAKYFFYIFYPLHLLLLYFLN